ncbi:hypothetical protein C1H46_009553 [Malus baccata]|uniref:Uncharacterized protein n=1 Tax=Malus baccata TaxID=106549 RepID=A0A540N1F9_MALBA|nr:hypothetical protein C1H46_009553 [Malus baccata]
MLSDLTFVDPSICKFRCVTWTSHFVTTELANLRWSGRASREAWKRSVRGCRTVSSVALPSSSIVS